MKLHPPALLPLLVALALASQAQLRADAPAPSAAAAPAAGTGTQADLDAIGRSIKAKIDQGSRSEADFADEIKRIDALLAKNSDRKTEDVAQVLVLKVMLYLEVFQDYDKSLAFLKQVSAGFPGTDSAKEAGDLIPKLEAELKSRSVAEALKPGTVFPPFSEQDLDGKPLKLESYRGHPVLVDFWATWCGPCVRELPNVVAAYAKYHPRGLEVVGISLDQDRTALVTFVKDKGMPWPEYYDGKGWENKLSRSYGVTSIPMNYLLDGDGKIVAEGLRGDDLDAKLAAMLPK